MIEVARIVTFRVGTDLFAVSIEHVERVLRYESPRRLPGAPDWVEGVIDYQGHVVPLIDVRRRFGLEEGGRAAQARVLVLTVGGEWLAVTVDGVLDVRALDAGALEPAPALFRAGGGAADAVQGLTRRGNDLVLVLDVGRLMAPLAAAVTTAIGDDQAAGR